MNVRNYRVYIEDQEALEAFVERARRSSVLAIDTEFLREKTYYARLCLIQFATDDEVAVVDPFCMEDLHVLAPLLEDAGVMKVLHSGGQDLEILWHEVGVLPQPLFDTQVAAALLGHTQQIGYGALVGAECGVALKKVDSFTDWSRRPLSESQLRYAADDVIYLPRMYEHMKQELERQGRLHWLDPEFAEMCDPARFESDERERYRRLKRVGQLSRKQLAAAREVAAWREVTAQKRNVPRKWVITDEQIVGGVQARGPHHRRSVHGARACARSSTPAMPERLLGLMKKALESGPRRAGPSLIAAAETSPTWMLRSTL